MRDERDDDGALPAIALRDAVIGGDRQAHPWRWRLSVFLRALAVVELCKGLFHWGALIGVGAGEGARPAAELIPHAVFAIADPVAAVGLWIGAAWGVAIWLLAALGQLAVIATGEAAAASVVVTGVEIVAMTAYLFLSLKARREGE